MRRFEWDNQLSGGQSVWLEQGLLRSKDARVKVTGQLVLILQLSVNAVLNGVR